MLLVTGPRIDPRQLPGQEGMDKRGYMPDLFEHLACADAAVVQGGLSTTMELVATGRPFIYFPLRRHWEQQHFVTHRLNHYRAGLRDNLGRRPGRRHADRPDAKCHRARLPPDTPRRRVPRLRTHRRLARWVTR